VIAKFIEVILLFSECWHTCQVVEIVAGSATGQSELSKRGGNEEYQSEELEQVLEYVPVGLG
jgi:hypothetical protein